MNDFLGMIDPTKLLVDYFGIKPELAVTWLEFFILSWLIGMLVLNLKYTLKGWKKDWIDLDSYSKLTISIITGFLSLVWAWISLAAILRWCELIAYYLPSLGSLISTILQKPGFVDLTKTFTIEIDALFLSIVYSWKKLTSIKSKEDHLAHVNLYLKYILYFAGFSATMAVLAVEIIDVNLGLVPRIIVVLCILFIGSLCYRNMIILNYEGYKKRMIGFKIYNEIRGFWHPLIIPLAGRPPLVKPSLVSGLPYRRAAFTRMLRVFLAYHLLLLFRGVFPDL